MEIKNLLPLLVSIAVVALPLLIACTGTRIPGEDPKPNGPNVKYAGIRSSYYGFADEDGQRRFPTPKEAATVIKNIAAKFEGAIPSAVWIIGGIHGQDCHLEFEETATTDPHIKFLGEYPDFWGNVRPHSHEDYLNEFDKIGAKIFLQVEPGRASMEEILRLCLDKYADHSCIVGFGVDVEWYPSDGETNGPGQGAKQPIDKKELQNLVSLVQLYGKELKVMAKHWETEYVGGKPVVDDVIYFNSSQSEGSELPRIFADWANYFSSNGVGFQLGYVGDSDYNEKNGIDSVDYKWWKPGGKGNFTDPITDFTKAIHSKMRNKNQEINIYWVDFTIRWSEFDDLWIE